MERGFLMKFYLKKTTAFILILIMIVGIIPINRWFNSSNVKAFATDETPIGYGSNGKFLAPIDQPNPDANAHNLAGHFGMYRSIKSEPVKMHKHGYNCSP